VVGEVVRGRARSPGLVDDCLGGRRGSRDPRCRCGAAGPTSVPEGRPLSAVADVHRDFEAV